MGHIQCNCEQCRHAKEQYTPQQSHDYRLLVTRWGLTPVSRHAGTDGEPAVAHGTSYEAMQAAKRLLESK